MKSAFARLVRKKSESLLHEKPFLVRFWLEQLLAYYPGKRKFEKKVWKYENGNKYVQT